MLVFKYGFFALISIIVNLIFQFFSLKLYNEDGSLYIAILIGTIAGLITKYILDKKWIFYHTAKNQKDDFKKFIAYSFMGVFTTAIFWGTEIAFDKLLPIANASYLGAALGLCVGYVIKYYLDKKYVFVCLEESYK